MVTSAAQTQIIAELYDKRRLSKAIPWYVVIYGALLAFVCGVWAEAWVWLAAGHWMNCDLNSAQMILERSTAVLEKEVGLPISKLPCKVLQYIRFCNNQF